MDAVALRDWTGGPPLGASDEEILRAAARERRVLVTFDVRTLPPLLLRWAETDRRHAGVILVSAKTYHPNDVRRLARALSRLAETESGGLEDQVLFLG